MTAARPSLENRQSFRFPSGDAINGELILPDGREWPISIVDQSASGFGVVAESLPPLNCGDVVELRTDSFSCETQVAHMTSNESGGSDTDESSPPSLYRVGFIRLRDISIESGIPQDGGRQICYEHASPSAAPNAVMMIAIVVALVGLAAAVIVPSMSRSTEQQRGDQAVSPEPSSSPSSSSSEPRRSFKLESSSGELSRMPGALPFVTTGVANELDLSDAQIERLRRIMSDTNDAIAKNDQMRRLLADARRDALDVLTRQQRQQWEHLTGESTSAR